MPNRTLLPVYKHLLVILLDSTIIIPTNLRYVAEMLPWSGKYLLLSFRHCLCAKYRYTSLKKVHTYIKRLGRLADLAYLRRRISLIYKFCLMKVRLMVKPGGGNQILYGIL